MFLVNFEYAGYLAGYWQQQYARQSILHHENVTLSHMASNSWEKDSVTTKDIVYKTNSWERDSAITIDNVYKTNSWVKDSVTTIDNVYETFDCKSW